MKLYLKVGTVPGMWYVVAKLRKADVRAKITLARW